MAKVTIVSTQTVKPTEAAPQEGGYYLTAWDEIQCGVYNKSVYLYNPPASGMFEALKESLGQGMTHYYPFAGRLMWAHGRLEVNCNTEYGALLVEAECDEDLDYFNADLAPEKMRLLVPPVDVDSTPMEELPLLCVQLTRLRCGGAALGIAMSHVLCDGFTGFQYCFSEWARLARGEPLKEAPCLDRKVLLSSAKEAQRRRQLSLSDHREFSPPPVLLGEQSGSDERKKEIIKLKLPLTEAQVNALKEAANSRASHDGDSRPYTRYEVITAHMWRCASKARGHKEEQPTAVYIVIDVRSRIRSIPFPPRYFGNAALRTEAISKAGELMSNPLWFACSKIREAISKVDEDYVWSSLEFLEKKEDISSYGVMSSSSEGTPYFGNPNLRVASWLSLPIYDLDFGWGNPVSMSPIARDLDGSSYMVPKPNHDRSIEVVLCLQLDHADLFTKYFYEDLPFLLFPSLL